MPRYLVAIHHPDTFQSSDESEATVRAIDALNEEMAAAGVVIITDGPYLETKEHTAVFGCWRSPAWTKRSRGRARR